MGNGFKPLWLPSPWTKVMHPTFAFLDFWLVCVKFVRKLKHFIKQNKFFGSFMMFKWYNFISLYCSIYPISYPGHFWWKLVRLLFWMGFCWKRVLGLNRFQYHRFFIVTATKMKPTGYDRTFHETDGLHTLIRDKCCGNQGRLERCIVVAYSL